MSSKQLKTVAIPDEVVMSKIYLIRNQKVMLDKDLAELYEVITGNLNKAVGRNLKRFPDDFMFQLKEDEFRNLIFQIGISSWAYYLKVRNFSNQKYSAQPSLPCSDQPYNH